MAQFPKAPLASKAPQPKVTESAPALLFERLVDLDPHRPSEPRPFRTLRPAEVRASVMRELARLLDTRRAISIEAALDEKEEDMTVLDYGIPDTTALSAQRLFDREDLAAVVEKAIRVFEPRLLSPQVTAEPVPGSRSAVTLTISGTLRIGMYMEPVSFPMALNSKAADVSG